MIVGFLSINWSINCPFKVIPQHLNLIQVRTLRFLLEGHAGHFTQVKTLHKKFLGWKCHKFVRTGPLAAPFSACFNAITSVVAILPTDLHNYLLLSPFSKSSMLQYLQSAVCGVWARVGERLL